MAHLLGTVRRQGVGGAFGSEGLVAGEHVPDRFGQPAGEVDLGDLGAALLADAGFRVLVALAVDGGGAGVGGGLDERPALSFTAGRFALGCPRLRLLGSVSEIPRSF